MRSTIFFPISHFYRAGLDSVFNLLDDGAANFIIREFILGLGFKDGIFDFDEYGPYNPFSHINSLEALLGVIVDPFENPFFKGGKVVPPSCVYWPLTKAK